MTVLLSLWHPTRSFAASSSWPAKQQQTRSSSPLLDDKRVCISGGGPCGLFLALLLLRKSPTVRITILEKGRRDEGGANAFGIGLGPRLLHSLNAVPGLRDEVESVGAESPSGMKIISRTDLSGRMASFLEGVDGKGGRRRQCQIRYGEGCAEIDLGAKEVTTTAGRRISYDLLIGADGINSAVRRALVEERDMKEEHYLARARWKALRLPPQPDFAANSMKPLRHPDLRGGRLLPRYPEGHVILAFWSGDGSNPGNLTTVEELKAMLTDALQDDPPRRAARRDWWWLGAAKDADVVGRRREIVFDDEAINLFLKTRPGRSHYMKVDRFHDDSVVLVGDAAHGMSSLLGQGCATGLKCTEVLADELGSESNRLSDALERYSKQCVLEAHAITDLNLMASAVSQAGPILKVLLLPFVLVQKMMGRTFFEQMGKVEVPYLQILRENWFLIPLARLRWRRERMPFQRKA